MTSKVAATKLRADVMESARIVAAYRGVQIQDLLSEILRPALARMEREEVERRLKEMEGRSK